MMYSSVSERNQRKSQMYNTMHHSYTNYCTEAILKSEMKLDYENEIFLNNLHLIPDPLMKNLADTLITAEKPEKLKKSNLESPIMPPRQPSKEDIRHDSALAGITNFFTGVFNMLSGAVFRSRSPVHYYDCFDAENRQGSPPIWRGANIDEQDKNGRTADKLSSDASNPNVFNMNTCKSPVSVCEEKLNQVKYLLSPKPPSNSVWLRKRPKKVFVEPGSVEDSFEDAFSPEDFVTLSKEPYIEYYSPSQYQGEELLETEAPKMKIETGPIEETAEIIKDMTESETSNTQDHLVDEKGMKDQSDKRALENITSTKEDTDKHQLVSSCEDKVSKLKALLQDKRKKMIKVEPSPEPIEHQKPVKPIPITKPVDKHYKNPHRLLDKRRKMKMKRCIQDDVNFANEINVEVIESSPSTPSTINSSSDTSLGDYFDEMKGRFRSVSNTESEDSFQIVFNDNPKQTRKASDCESEDSFIVFEDDNCYTSNDIFGNSDCDSDSDVSDSGCSTMTCKLSHSLSRTVSNLTDDTLYESNDEVDCAKVEPVIEAKGLLMDDRKKCLRKDQPAKKVTFSNEPPTVKVMRVWAFAAKQARAGHWERFALDRDRFKRRIADLDMALSWVLKPQHRARVMFQRFMPWWNQMKRKELAEKKEVERQKKEEEERRIAAEKIREEVKESTEGEDENNDGEKNMNNEENKEANNVSSSNIAETKSTDVINNKVDNIVIDKTSTVKENSKHANVKENEISIDTKKYISTKDTAKNDGSIKSPRQKCTVNKICS